MTTTTNSSNNCQLNFENYTGKVHFILWAKITNGTNTYYEFNAYSSEIKTTDTETGEETLDTVKFELKKEGQSSAIVEVSGIETEEEASYYLIITNSSTKPNVENIKEEDKLSLTYDETSKTFKSHSDIAKYVELNQELYASVLKQGEDGNTIIVSGKKLTRYAEPKYAEAISDTTHVTYTNAQIITNFTHSFANNRKMQIKIGKITDKSILRKIKNKDASAFSDLLKYAKSNSGIYNQNVEAEKSNSILSYKQKINRFPFVVPP